MYFKNLKTHELFIDQIKQYNRKLNTKLGALKTLNQKIFKSD